MRARTGLENEQTISKEGQDTKMYTDIKNNLIKYLIIF
jgi:hypothetical protein